MSINKLAETRKHLIGGQISIRHGKMGLTVSFFVSNWDRLVLIMRNGDADPLRQSFRVSQWNIPDMAVPLGVPPQRSKHYQHGVAKETSLRVWTRTNTFTLENASFSVLAWIQSGVQTWNRLKPHCGIPQPHKIRFGLLSGERCCFTKLQTNYDDVFFSPTIYALHKFLDEKSLQNTILMGECIKSTSWFRFHWWKSLK